MSYEVKINWGDYFEAHGIKKQAEAFIKEEAAKLGAIYAEVGAVNTERWNINGKEVWVETYPVSYYDDSGWRGNSIIGEVLDTGEFVYDTLD